MPLLKNGLVKRKGGISGSREEELFWWFCFCRESKSVLIVQQMRKNLKRR